MKTASEIEELVMDVDSNSIATSATRSEAPSTPDPEFNNTTTTTADKMTDQLRVPPPKCGEASRSGLSEDEGDLQIVEEFRDSPSPVKSKPKEHRGGDQDSDLEIVEEFEDSPAKSKKIMSTQSSSEDEDSDLEILASKIKSGSKPAASSSRLSNKSDSDVSDAQIKDSLDSLPKRKKLFSDESDDDDGARTNSNTITGKSRHMLLGSDSSDDEDLHKSKHSDESGNKSKSVPVRPKLFSDDESNDENDPVKPPPERKRTYLTDDSDEELLDIGAGFTPTKATSRSSDDGKSKGHREKKKKLPTRKEREETMKKITSQTQKLQRERSTALPYHKPKQLSLDAFLQRRNPHPSTEKPNATENTLPSLSNQPRKTLIPDKLPRSHIPNLRKINYTLDDLELMEEKVLGTGTKTEPKNINDDIIVDSEKEEEEEEKLRQTEIKKVDDIIGTGEAQPTVTIKNWLETTSTEADGNEDAEMPAELNGKDINPKEVPESNQDFNSLFKSVEASVDKQGESIEQQKLEEQNWLEEMLCNDMKDYDKERISKAFRTVADELVEMEISEHDTSFSQTPPRDPSSSKVTKIDEAKVEKAAVKKKSIRELLEALPNYKKIAELKPMLSKDTNEHFVDLTLEDSSVQNRRAGAARKSAQSAGGSSNVQKLMDRFVKHTIIPKKPKEEHYNIQVCKKIEDSQGVEKEVVENFDYVAHNDNDLDNATSMRPSARASPGQTPPGLKFETLKEQLNAQIRARKLKEYEEKVKAFAMYNEEKCPEDKDVEEEIEEDVSSSSSGESEPDETDEEALEEYLRQKDKKKKGKKLVFMDDEAEEVDLANEDDENENMAEMDVVSNGTAEEDSEDDNHETEDEDDNEEAEKIQPSSRRTRTLLFEDSDEDSKESANNIPTPTPRITNFMEKYCENDDEDKDNSVEKSANARSIQAKNSEEDSNNLVQNESGNRVVQSNSQWVASVFELKDTTPEILLRPLGLRTYARRTQDQERSLPSPPLKETESDQDQAFDTFLEGMGVTDNIHVPKSPNTSEHDDNASRSPDLPDIVCNKQMLVPPSDMDSPRFTQDEDAMLGLCSAKFPTQQPVTPEETQYSNFNFSQDAIDVDDNDNKSSVDGDDSAQTPANNKSTNYKNTETPKLTDRTSASRILFGKGDVSETEVNEKDVTAQDEVAPSPPTERKKFSRIQVLEEKSDNEDEFVFVENNNLDNFMSDSDAESKDEDDGDHDDEKVDDDEEGIEKPKPFKAFKTKTGKIRRDLVEDEAELSGSEEASSDEDERNLDDDDNDLVNDEEAFDEEVVKAQVERAHLKQMIDDDQRQVRILQELYLEDGDLHGDGNVRQKLFTWGNLDMNDEEARMDGMEEGVEDEAEVLWQQQHQEKLKWMNDNPQFQKRDEIDEEESHSLMKIMKETTKSNSFGIRKNTMRKIESFVSFSQESMSMLNESSTSTRLNSSKFSASESDDPSKQSSDPSVKLAFGKDAPSPVSPKSKQLSSSFLRRGSPFLSKIAGLNKTCELSLAGSKVNSRNFVFSVLSPSEKEATVSHDPSDDHKNKRKAKHPAKFQPKKIAKVDPARGSSSNAKRTTSVFKWMKT